MRRTRRTRPPARLGRNVYALAAVSFFTDVSSEMIYPLLPVFLPRCSARAPGFIGAIEGRRGVDGGAAQARRAAGGRIACNGGSRSSSRATRSRRAMRPLVAIAQVGDAGAA